VVRFRDARKLLPGKPKMLTLAQEASGAWTVSFMVVMTAQEQQDRQDRFPLPAGIVAIGIDQNLGDDCRFATSDGRKLARNRYHKQKLGRLKMLSRRLARKKKGSARYKKASQKLARTHAHVRHMREDDLQKTTTELMRSATVLALESLDVAEMLAKSNTKAKPALPALVAPADAAPVCEVITPSTMMTAPAPAATNADVMVAPPNPFAKPAPVKRPFVSERSKAQRFSQQDAAFGRASTLIEQKAHRYGRQFFRCDPWDATSKTCSTPGCYHYMMDLQPGVRTWTCPSCGTTHDRDINAARNILVWALDPELARTIRDQQRLIRAAVKAAPGSSAVPTTAALRKMGGVSPLTDVEGTGDGPGETSIRFPDVGGSW